MQDDEAALDVTAIVESVRRKIEHRATGRPRTPPFDAQVVGHIVSMRQAADPYHVPLASGVGVASSAMASLRKALRRMLLPWIIRQRGYNETAALAIDGLRDQIDLLAYHQALTTEDLLDVQTRSLEALRSRVEATVPASLRSDVAAAQAELATLAGQLADLRTEASAMREQVSAMREEEAAIRSEVAGIAAEVPALQGELGSVRATLEASEQESRESARASIDQLRAAHATMLQSLRERLARVERRLRRWSEPSPEAAGSRLVPTPESARPQPPDFDYAGFEERFRGAEDEIRERQRAYLPYFTGAGRVVDLGCGRGEFLELLRDAGIDGEGVEVDLDMLLCCRDKGLQVTQRDLVDWLEHQAVGSLGGIMSAQVVEHMPPSEVIRLVTLAHRALAPGARLILETVNPCCVGALTSFFVDFTHVRPLHPDGMQFLFESLGFADVELRFSSFIDASSQVPEVPHAPGLTDAACLFNPAIRRVNELLYGPHDYAVIGRKVGANGG